MNNDITDRLDTLEITCRRLANRLEQVLQALQTPTVARRHLSAGKVTQTSAEARQKRVAAIERQFWTLANSPLQKRRDVYRFPSYLIERLGDAPLQAVTVSMLINQASIRKIFRPLPGEEGTSPADLARTALQNSNLIVIKALQARLETTAETPVALSPAAANRLVRNKSLLPREWRGWSCVERAADWVDVVTGELRAPEPDPSDGSQPAEEKPLRPVFQDDIADVDLEDDGDESPPARKTTDKKPTFDWSSEEEDDEDLDTEPEPPRVPVVKKGPVFDRESFENAPAEDSVESQLAAKGLKPLKINVKTSIEK